MQPIQQTFFASHLKSRQAFSLLELSLVIIIISLMLAAMMPIVTQSALAKKQTDLNAKLDAIEAALMAYRAANGRLPCPSIPVAVSDANFGVEASNPGTCTSALVLDNATADTSVVAGTLPVRTLGLADEYAFDPWERSFSYTVDKRITANDAFATYPIDNTAIGNITVKELQDGSVGATLTSKALVVVTSFGPNGHGGILTSGVRYSSDSTNAEELKNCYCTTAAAFNATTPVTFYTGLNTTSSVATAAKFDDTLRYYVRSAFVSSTELTNSQN